MNGTSLGIQEVLMGTAAVTSKQAYVWDGPSVGWELKQNENEILQKYPVIRRLIEGGIIEEEITLSVNEQKAFEKYQIIKWKL